MLSQFVLFLVYFSTLIIQYFINGNLIVQLIKYSDIVLKLTMTEYHAKKKEV